MDSFRGEFLAPGDLVALLSEKRAKHGRGSGQHEWRETRRFLASR